MSLQFLTEGITTMYEHTWNYRGKMKILDLKLLNMFLLAVYLHILDHTFDVFSVS